MFNNEVKIGGTQMYRLNPKKGWRFIEFDGKNPSKIDGVEYSPARFINSDQFIIHEVICFMKVEIASARDVFHIWYEKVTE